MKKVLALLMSGLMCLSIAGCGVKAPAAKTQKTVYETAASNVSREDTKVTQTEREYEAMMKDLGNFPMSFVYDDTYYKGFDRLVEAGRTRSEEKGVISYDIRLALGESLEAEIISHYYRGHKTFDYTVYFSNPSNANSGVIKYVNDIIMDVEGGNAVLKGNHGDHTTLFTPYEHDLKESPAHFISLLGRATHEECPYFDLQHDGGHTILALGWGGTWKADFVYDDEKKSTHVTGNGTAELNTYLKPGEKIRTSLVAVLRTEEKEEDVAMNEWRRWMVDCMIPRESPDTDKPADPFTTVYLGLDTGKVLSSDGSVCEDQNTWKRSIDAFYSHGLTADYCWVDAGWYRTPNGGTCGSDWWGTVGTWQLDPVKWPGNTFRERVDYQREHGTGALLWFEPERVTHIADMVARQNYKFEWALSDHGDNNCYLNNLGNPDCLDWTTDRILTMMEENDIDLYREDFNIDPQLFWDIGDGYEGSNRRGITENLYMQGHYELLDRIIAWCAERGKANYVDSCASGGGRNDLETLRRAIVLNRSDADRANMAVCLADTTRMSYWIPYFGRNAKGGNNDVQAGVTDIYVMRGNLFPVVGFINEYATKESEQCWDDMKQGLDEWKVANKYLLKDFYVLTPQRGTYETKEWTSYMYFDPDANEGLLFAFRPEECTQGSYLVKLKGLDPDRYYSLRDADGVQSLERVRGSALLRGIPVTAKNPRTALLFFIEPAN